MLKHSALQPEDVHCLHYETCLSCWCFDWFCSDWGGAPTNSGLCACGTRGVCANDTSLACHCDARSDVELIDEGYLIDKTVLPVSRVCIGAENATVNATRQAAYYVRKLECSNRQLGL